MSTLTEQAYKKLKSEVEETSKKAERARGALQETITQLKEEFNCKSLKEAKNKLAALEVRAEAAKQEFERAVAAYESKWAEQEDE